MPSGKLPLALGSEDTAISAPTWPSLGLAWLSGLLCFVLEHPYSPRTALAHSHLSSFSSAPWVPSSPPCGSSPNSLAQLSSKMHLTQVSVVSPTGWHDRLAVSHLSVWSRIPAYSDPEGPGVPLMWPCMPGVLSSEPEGGSCFSQAVLRSDEASLSPPWCSLGSRSFVPTSSGKCWTHSEPRILPLCT